MRSRVMKAVPMSVLSHMPSLSHPSACTYVCCSGDPTLTLRSRAASSHRQADSRHLARQGPGYDRA